MGIYEFKLPDIGEGVVEGEVVEWLVSVGQSIAEDDPILSVMTDKATVEIPSPVDGTVVEVIGEPGDILPVGGVCIRMEVEGDGNASEDAEAPPAAESTPTKVTATPTPAPTPAPAPARVSSAHAEPLGSVATRPLASPAVRRAAREGGIDLTSLRGTGPSGRITHDDLAAWARGSTGAASRSRRSDTTEIPVIGLRRRIAEQMARSYSNIPHFSYFEEVDVTELEALRAHLNATRAEGQPKLTYLPFIMQALVRALGDRPECNATYDDEAGVVTRHGAIHLGIATATDRGLYVPVVHHVEAMDLWKTASSMIEVTSAARDGTASLDVLSGSTFTITSLGRMGGLGATPIINHPEVAILGVHNAVETPVVRNGQIVVRRMLRLSSSFDHRVVDGFDGASMVQALKGYLEHPATIFM